MLNKRATVRFSGVFDRELEEEVARPTKRRRVGRTVIVAERRIVIHGELESKDENKVQEVTVTVEEMAETVESLFGNV